METKIVKLFKAFLEENHDLCNDYELFCLYGSVLTKRFPRDVDLLTIGNSENHKRLTGLLKEFFETRGYFVNFIKLTREAPLEISKNKLYIHLIHADSFEQLKDVLWDEVINSIRFKGLALIGSLSSIKYIEVKQERLFIHLYGWLKNIDNYNEYLIFRRYVKKTSQLNVKDYPLLNLREKYDCLIKLLKITDWENSKRKSLAYLKSSYQTS